MGSLPQIVNEIWTALGDTGQTIRKSIVWFIDNVSVTELIAAPKDVFGQPVVRTVRTIGAPVPLCVIVL